MKNTITTITLEALLLLPLCLFSQEKPNFVFFLVDDLGTKDIGVYGSSFYDTPNVDQLAADGMMFTEAYATGCVCTPTRASIMTGKAPARLRITQYSQGTLSHDDTIIPEALKANGYATFFAGKWHLNRQGDDTIENWPQGRGFDVNIGGHWRGGLYIPNNYFSPYVDGDGNQIPNIESGPDGEYITDRLGQECAKFIEDNQDRPFLAYLSFYTVHAPFNAPADRVTPYQQKKDSLNYTNEERFDPWPSGANHVRAKQDHPTYAAMVNSMDMAVGLVMDKLEELNLTDNTIVFFFSDNGGLSTSEGEPTSNYPYKAGKGYLYEGGVREPCIVKWPGVVEPGAQASGMITSNDFYPTILEMAGLDLMPDQHMDGKSFVPLLKQQYNQIHSTLYWHYPHGSNQGGRPAGAVRVGKYKLIENYESNTVELYDLEEDIGEENDLSDELTALRDSLLGIMYGWRDTVDAYFNNPRDYTPIAGVTKYEEPPLLEGCMDILAENYDVKWTSPCPGCCEYDTAVHVTSAPSSGQVQIRQNGIEIDITAAGPHTVTMQDLAGRIVYHRRGTGPAVYRPRGLSAGLYLVEATTLMGGITGKLYRY